MKNERFCTFHFELCILSKRGFSLIELIAVMLLIALAAAIAVPAIDRAMRKREVKQSALGLAAVARDLRRQAVYGGVPLRLTVSPSENGYHASGKPPVYLSQELRISRVEGGEPIDNRLRQFVFFPNGSILDGMIELSDREGISYVISFDPLAGRVVVTHQ
jgi:general secretion pathway protein H